MAQTYEPEDDQLVAIRGLGFSSSSSEGTTLDAKAAITNFKKGEDCFECVRDIQRYLRRDTPERPFHLRLSQLRVLPMRLLPLAVGPASVGEKRLQLAVIKLLVTMTMPLTDEFDAKLRAAHESYLRSYVLNFLQEDVIAVFVLLLEPALAHEDPTNRTRDENMLLELVLTLFRNLLLVESAPAKISGGNARDSQTHVHEELVMMMHKEQVIAVVLFLAQSVEVVGNQEWNLLILEMTHLIFRGIDPAGLVAAPIRHAGRSSVAKAGSGAASGAAAAAAPPPRRDPLVAMRRAEKSRQGTRGRGSSRRHSHFGASFKARVGVDNRGNRNRFVMLSHPDADPAAALAKLQPARRRQGGKKADDLADSRAAMSAMGRRDGDALHGSVGSNAALDAVPGLRVALRKTLVTFVAQGFKPLAQSVFKEIMRKSSKLIDSDTQQFIALLWNALRFYQNYSAEEGRWVRAQVAKMQMLKTPAGKKRRVAIEAELKRRNKLRGEMALNVQFCMTEKRLWEFVTRKTQMYAGLDETKMEHNWGSVASAAALLREMLTLLRGERENALRAATKAQEAQQRENLTATQMKRANAKTKKSIKMAETVDKLVQAMFYQRDLLEMVPALIAQWESTRGSIEFLRDLVVASDALLSMIDSMAETGKLKVLSRRRAVVIQKKKAAKATPKLEDAGGEAKDGEAKPPPIVVDPNAEGGADGAAATAADASASAAAPVDSTAVAIVTATPGKEGEEKKAEAEKIEAAAAQIAKGEEMLDSLRVEETLDSSEFFNRSFATTHVISHYAHLLGKYETNSPLVNNCVINYLRRMASIELQAGTLRTALYTLPCMMTFEKILSDSSTRGSAAPAHLTAVRAFVVDISKQFLLAAQGNPMMYVEVVFNRSRRSVHEQINSHYWTSRESIDARDAKKRKQGRRGRRGGEDSDEDSVASEDEADLDVESDGDGEAPWDASEDRVLIAKWESVEALESRFDLLAFEPALLAKDRTAEGVKKRVRFLGLLGNGGIAGRLRRSRRGGGGGGDAAATLANSSIATEIRREEQLQQMASIRQAAKGLITHARGGRKQGLDAVEWVTTRLQQCIELRDRDRKAALRRAQNAVRNARLREMRAAAAKVNAAKAAKAAEAEEAAAAAVAAAAAEKETETAVEASMDTEQATAVESTETEKVNDEDDDDDEDELDLSIAAPSQIEAEASTQPSTQVAEAAAAAAAEEEETEVPTAEAMEEEEGETAAENAVAAETEAEAEVETNEHSAAGAVPYALVPFVADEFDFFGERRFKTLLRALLVEAPPKDGDEPRRWWRIAPEQAMPEDHLRAAVRTLNHVLRQRKVGGGKKKKKKVKAKESARKRLKRSEAEEESEEEEGSATKTKGAAAADSLATTVPRVAVAKAGSTKGKKKKKSTTKKKRRAESGASTEGVAAGGEKKRRRRIVMQSDESDESDDDAFA